MQVLQVLKVRERPGGFPGEAHPAMLRANIAVETEVLESFQPGDGGDRRVGQAGLRNQLEMRELRHGFEQPNAGVGCPAGVEAKLAQRLQLDDVFDGRVAEPVAVVIQIVQR